MATREISRVPTSSGTKPKEPEAATWSIRMAICGLHCRPNRKSVTGIDWKKRRASNNTDRTMPRVVNTAIKEQVNRIHLKMFST